ncbi:hypothetical protein [Aureliella helgolandensis]|uniref:TIGR03790 family protein n=1 Tax=Aureliella helgolandensis TaxID=2527968 RepID=A0A518GDM0_9BACT|nr:hypothetical protein [Aureliella helgolandensis]QDV26704.1 hypothetical protein Q31a_50820 [Aureliella helgolandensis]
MSGHTMPYRTTPFCPSTDHSPENLLSSIPEAAIRPGPTPPTRRPTRTAGGLCIAAYLLLCLAPHTSQHAQAGLGASDVVVVINSTSLNSKTLANHYVQLRHIPPRNVISLDNVPSSEVISVDDFRDRILRPLLGEIDRRQLGQHIQCIAYSADFPTAIDISKDIEPLGELPIYFTKQGSLNGLTYLHSAVMAESPTYIDLLANSYGRRPVDAYFERPFDQETQQRWNTSQQMIRNSEHQAASDLLYQLFTERPNQFPLAYLAAAEAAQAGQPQVAIQRLQTAIAAGWYDADYLAQDARFDSLRDESEFQVLEYTLEPNPSGYQKATGFEARLPWAPNGTPTKDQRLGTRFLLSTVLGVTRGGGTTLDEAIDCLTRAASADATHPQGSFYFSSTADVRTKTRLPGFANAISSLQAMGFGAEEIVTSLPQRREHVLGAQIGTPNFDWPSCRSQLVPGAIAENLTSLGGVMRSPGGQTKLTELTKAGAAGSSGTVTEPYALQPKFPHPRLYVNYAEGASLAEAFYLNVLGPYQLLIVGDPLCQPFSNAPAPELDLHLRHIELGDSIPLEFPPDAPKYSDWSKLDGSRADRRTPLAPVTISMLFDGASLRAGRIQPSVKLRLNNLPAGFHELTVRLAADDPLSQRSDFPLPVWIGPTNSIQADWIDHPKSQSTNSVTSDQLNSTPATPHRISLQKQTATIHIKAPGATSLAILHNWKELNRTPGEEGTLEVSLEDIGRGPCLLRPQATLPDGSTIQGLPMELEITP